MARPATKTIITHRPEPKTPDNPLHSFVNSTYKLSLLTWNSREAYNRHIQSNNPYIEMLNASNQPGGELITLFSSGGIPENDRNNEEFGLDFYIDNLSVSSTIGVSKITRATNIMEANMNVIEPNGTTLLDRLHNLMGEDDNWSDFPFLLKIDFLGYTTLNSKPRKIPSMARFVPIRFTEIQFDVQPSGTVYTMKMIARATPKMGATTSTIQDSVTLEGSSVKSFFDQLQKVFNDKEKNMVNYGIGNPSDSDIEDARANRVKNNTKENYGKPHYVSGAQIQAVADQIEFEIDDDIATSLVKGTIIDKTPISPELKAEASLSRSYGEHGRARLIELPPEEEANRFKTITVGENRQMTFDKGTTFIAMIEKILIHSGYISSQISDPSAIEAGQEKIKQVLKDPESGLNWWKITHVPLLLEWDDIRGQYGTKTIIQITKFNIKDPLVTNSKAPPKPVRNYQYIYTGNNIDIQELQMSFNNAFVQALGHSPITSDEQGKRVKENQNLVTGTSDNKKNALPSSANKKINPTMTDPNEAHTPKQALNFSLMEQLYSKPGSDLLSIEMNIVGDPSFIQQDGIVNLTTESKVGKPDEPEVVYDENTGCILPDAQDVHVYISFKTPNDYNEQRGIYDFQSDAKYRANILNGYFKILRVSSTFSQGKFNQTLEAIRLHNQYPENRQNAAAQKNNTTNQPKQPRPTPEKSVEEKPITGKSVATDDLRGSRIRGGTNQTRSVKSTDDLRGSRIRGGTNQTRRYLNYRNLTRSGEAIAPVGNRLRSVTDIRRTNA